MSNLVIYTAISGKYDRLKEPRHVIKGADYVCFVGGYKSFRSKVWDIRPLPNKKVDVVRRARFPKLLPHRLFPNHEMSIWLDGSMQIKKKNLSDLIKKHLNYHDFSLCRHCRNRPSMAAEVRKCITKNKDDPTILKKQLEAYSEVNPEIPICETGMLLRRHSVAIQNAMEDWWEELVKFSSRDQISLPYIIWKHKLHIKIMEMNVRNNPWIISKAHQ